ncbi:hypothetical protein WA026_008069 [Henosepilachna vigintioctopunctata]|uniref:Uncharacterized protein n=1 Tax=Henosepilachna vigintioctopunctata TaxID=420089 RepID=A0AAW1TR21_9CUCU
MNICTSKLNICLGLLLLISGWSNCTPVLEQSEGLIRNTEKYDNSEARQGVITNWIQNINLKPLGVNIPGIISNTSSGVQHVVGEGFQNASATVGEGFQIFGQGIQAVGQSVGNGIKNFGQAVGESYQAVVTTLGQRFPLVNRLPVPGTNKIESTPEVSIMPINQINTVNPDPEVSSHSSAIIPKT